MKRIDLNTVNTAQTRQPQRTDLSRPSGTSGSPHNVRPSNKTAGDHVDVSSTAREVGQLVDRAKNLPDIRQEKVDSLRKLVDSGQYEVSSNTIAEAILRDEQ